MRTIRSSKGIMEKITQEELKKLLHYDPDTGVFRWKRSGKFFDKEAGGIAVMHSGIEYIRIGVSGVQYCAHRLAFLYMTGGMPKEQVDHINGNGLDNRWCNLREVSNLINQRNRKMPISNKSGIQGVSWNKRRSNWRVQISINKKCKEIGAFNNIFDAACAIKNAYTNHGFHENHGR